MQKGNIEQDKLLNTKKCYVNVPFGLPVEGYRKEYDKEYRNINKDEHKEQRKEYNEDNKENISQYKKFVRSFKCQCECHGGSKVSRGVNACAANAVSLMKTHISKSTLGFMTCQRLPVDFPCSAGAVGAVQLVRACAAGTAGAVHALL